VNIAVPDMRDVYSSHVSRIGFDDGKLIVEWNSGKTSIYPGVPEQLANEVMNSPSIGSALRERIKGVYSHTYL
jgi:hypothetical protein